MGKNQLFLLALTIIIVAITFFVGMTSFQTSNTEANREAIISDLVHLSCIAQEYYQKPKAIGGGGNSYANFKIPASYLKTANGTIEHIKVGHPLNHIHLKETGTAIGEDGIEPIAIEIRISINDIELTEYNTSAVPPEKAPKL